MKQYLNNELIKILICILLLLISITIENSNTKIILLAISYIVISYDIYKKAINNLKNKEIFDENFLMIIATLGAFYIGSNTEAVMVMLLFEIGEYFSHLAVHKSKKSITKLMNLKVEKVNLVVEDTTKLVKIEKVNLGDYFIVKPGEKIPLDGIIVEGSSFIDTSSLTGESVPRKVEKYDQVLSGCINKEGLLKIKSTSTYTTSTTARILKLIEESNERKSKTETFIRRFAKVYTPIIVFLALILVLIPTLLGFDFKTWLYRALIFLVTSCPCALVISVPLGYFCGIGKASRVGALIKGGKELENLTEVDYLLLDKTGTITEGIFKVTNVKTKILSEKEFIKIVASAEENSIHPISSAIKEYNKEKILKVKDYQEITGKGISCTINNKKILVGNKTLLEENNIVVDKVNEIGTIIYVSIDNIYEGYIVISDKIKESSYKVKDLLNVINKKIIVLSGDNEDIVEKVSKEIGISTYYGSLLPEDKVRHVKNYNKKGKTIFVGDGINDAPVIKIADVGVSMGGIGSDAAIEASDVVLMNDNLDTLRKTINIARITKIKVSQNIAFALIVKFLVLILGTLGLSTIWMAVIADVGVTFIAIINVLTILLEKVE